MKKREYFANYVFEEVYCRMRDAYQKTNRSDLDSAYDLLLKEARRLSNNEFDVLHETYLMFVGMM